ETAFCIGADRVGRARGRLELAGEKLLGRKLGIVGMFERRQRLRLKRAEVLRKRGERRGAEDTEQKRDQNWAGWHCVPLCATKVSMEGRHRPDRNWLILSFAWCNDLPFQEQ